jgi:hypothetical protein
MDQITYLNNLAKHLSGYYREEVLILPKPVKSKRYKRLCLMGRGQRKGEPVFELLLDTQPDPNKKEKLWGGCNPINTDFNIGVRKHIQTEILSVLRDKIRYIKKEVIPEAIEHIQNELGWRTVIRIHPSTGSWDCCGYDTTEINLFSANNRSLFRYWFRPSGRISGLECDAPSGFYWKATDYLEREELARSRIRAAENRRKYEEQKLKNQSPSSPSI